MPHAAGGRLQPIFEGELDGSILVFQCRTRQVVGCNSNGMGMNTPVFKFQCRTRQVVGCNRHDIMLWGETQQMFQCRTRQVVGCNDVKEMMLRW